MREDHHKLRLVKNRNNIKLEECKMEKLKSWLSMRREKMKREESTKEKCCRKNWVKEIQMTANSILQKKKKLIKMESNWLMKQIVILSFSICKDRLKKINRIKRKKEKREKRIKQIHSKQIKMKKVIMRIFQMFRILKKVVDLNTTYWLVETCK